jgi:hypothetical protein
MPDAVARNLTTYTEMHVGMWWIDPRAVALVDATYVSL